MISGFQAPVVSNSIAVHPGGAGAWPQRRHGRLARVVVVDLPDSIACGLVDGRELIYATRLERDVLDRPFERTARALRGWGGAAVQINSASPRPGGTRWAV